MQTQPMEFLKEAAIMHTIDSEHIVRLYGVVLDTSALMLVSWSIVLMLTQKLRYSTWENFGNVYLSGQKNGYKYSPVLGFSGNRVGTTPVTTGMYQGAVPSCQLPSHFPLPLLNTNMWWHVISGGQEINPQVSHLIAVASTVLSCIRHFWVINI